jgi:queuine tRNA-ribosyltransferase
MSIRFSIAAQCGLARTGVLHTAHGAVHTPVFMPVGTAGTVKGLTPEQVEQTGAEIILGNTYHLMLRPGAARVERLGGLHRMMRWERPILTDSGGFQVMSLADRCVLTEAGAQFKSHIDGTVHHLSPEDAMEIQRQLGSTISMVLDECTAYPAEHAQAEASMQRSMRWAARCREAFSQRDGYAVFGIQQGSMYENLRRASSDALTSIGFDGYAIGGLAVGEGQETMFSVLDYAVAMLPDSHPRYLMGVGKPADILGAVERGVDMFDCVIPTRSGRLGRAYTPGGEINIKNARHAEDPSPLWEGLECPASRFSRAYLHHLFKAGEMLGPILLSWHNVFYYQELMRGMRAAIAGGTLPDFATACRDGWAVTPCHPSLLLPPCGGAHETKA